MNPKQLAQQIKENIMNHELTIYHESEVGDPDFWYPANEMEYLLTDQLAGYNLDGFALRTRSKIVKSQVCEALGYPVPKSFKKHNHDFYVKNLTYIPKNQTTYRYGMKKFLHLDATF